MASPLFGSEPMKVEENLSVSKKARRRLSQAPSTSGRASIFFWSLAKATSVDFVWCTRTTALRSYYYLQRLDEHFALLTSPLPSPPIDDPATKYPEYLVSL